MTLERRRAPEVWVQARVPIDQEGKLNEAIARFEEMSRLLEPVLAPTI